MSKDYGKISNTTKVGSGFSYEDIARHLNILNKTNDNPNKKLIKYIIENYVSNPVVTGEIAITADIYSKGRVAGYNHRIPLFNGEVVEVVHQIISNKAELIGRNLYEIDGIEFRVKQR